MIVRLLTALLFVAPLLIAVVPSRLFIPGFLEPRYRAREHLFYSYLGDRPLEFSVPGGTERVELQCVAAVDVGTYSPSQRYAFSLKAEFRKSGTSPPRSFELDLNSRVSVLGKRRSPLAVYGARMYRLSGEMTDPRWVTLRVPRRFRGGVMRIVAMEGATRRVWVRPFGVQTESTGLQRYQKLDLETEDRRQRVKEYGTGLGMDDLPASLRDALLLAAAYRLVPLGRKGDDFDVRKVVTTDYRRPISQTDHAPLPCSPQFHLAFNVRGPIRLFFEAERSSRVVVADGVAEDSRDIALDLEALESQELRMDAPPDAARTLVVSCPDRLTPLRVSTNDAGYGALLGETPVLRSERRLKNPFELRPDIRSSRYIRLHPAEPVAFHMPEDTEAVVSLRVEMPDNASSTTLRAAFRLDDAPFELIDRPAVRSFFERIGGSGLVSDPSSRRIQVRAGEVLEVLGARTALLKVALRVPGVTELVRARYRGQGGRFRYAPRDLDASAWARPRNFDKLSREGRMVTVAQQVRLRDPRRALRMARRTASRAAEIAATATKVPRGPGEQTAPSRGAEEGIARRSTAQQQGQVSETGGQAGGQLEGASLDASTAFRQASGVQAWERWRDRFRPGPRYTRVIRPLGSPLSQRISVYQRSAPTEARRGMLTEVHRERRVHVRQQDPVHRLLLRPAEERLGSPITVFVDREPVSTFRVYTTAEQIALDLSPGEHALHVQGVGFESGGRAFSTAAPVEGGVFRMRRYHSLQAPLVFEVPVERFERQVAFAQLVSSEPIEGYSLEFTMHHDGSALVTALRAGRTRPESTVRFWDRPMSHRAGFARARVPFARAPRSGVRRIEVRRNRDGGGALWLRMVLVTERPGTDPEAVVSVSRRTAFAPGL
ncbi:MAG: hypothetical protein AAF355_07770 [Myxococcota bacterium]